MNTPISTPTINQRRITPTQAGKRTSLGLSPLPSSLSAQSNDSSNRSNSSTVTQTRQLLVDQFFDPLSSKQNSVQLENIRQLRFQNAIKLSNSNESQDESLSRRFKGFEFLTHNTVNDMESDINKQNHEIVREINQLEKYVKGDLKRSIEINDYQYQENEKRFDNTMREITQLKYKISQYVLQIQHNTEKLVKEKEQNKFYQRTNNNNKPQSESVDNKVELDKFEKMLHQLNEHEATLTKSNQDLKLIKSRLKQLNVKLQQYQTIQIKKYEKLKFYKRVIICALILVILVSYRGYII
ncbi:hypothetical protein WICPIJ_001139 [Wickerhamomyces pijperi]|uniref:Uncharacterized protein n=1 Tax=Wickerhamomyces pijperi TaxID=599730 RepID=A0A9P8TRJ1_WICPI|nr:hypothetical protein WICPIJ_001139 [Wickerhamomyces pijperi]